MQYPLFEPPAVWSLTQVSELPDWAGAERVGLDTETKDPNLLVTGPSVRTGGYVVGISFALEDGPSHYLPIRHEAGGNLPPPEVIAYLRDQAARYTGILVGANLNYDLDYLAELGIVFPLISGQRDVQIADPLIYELHDSYSLESIAGRWGFAGKNEAHLRAAAAAYGIKSDEVKGNLWRMPGTHVGPYASDDAALPLRILRRQEKEIDDKDLWRVFNVESRLQPILLRMTRHGVKVDRRRLAEIGEWALQEELRQLDEIQRLTGRRLKAGDVNSKGPLIPLLQDLGVRLGQTEKTKAPKIDKAALDEAQHPVARAIVRARKVNKLRTTFVASIERHLVGDRIHCQYSQIRSERRQGDERGPRWGRISAADPNLQQQPARDDFADRWRSIYIPDDPSLLWVSSDFSGQEPRMLVHYAELAKLPGAKRMAEEYRTNPRADNHNMTTVMLHPEYADMDPKDPVFDHARSSAKTIYLGLCLGRGTALWTNRGPVPIEQVTRDDRLWDGKEFVAHGGVVHTGVKACIEVAGTWMTPTHEVLTPIGWCQAQDLFTLSQNLDQFTDSSQLSRLSEDLGAESSPSCAVAPVVDQLLHSAAIWSEGTRHAVLSVVRRRLLRHVRVMGDPAPIVDGFLTEFVALFRAALRNQPIDTEGAASAYTSLGLLTEHCFSTTCIRFPDMMTQISTSTGLTTTGTTSQGTCGSPRTPRTCAIEAYDVLDAGPRSRFCLGTGMVVSNCYGMGDGMLAKRLGLPTYTEKSKDGVVRLKSGPEGLAVLEKFHRQVPYVGGMAKKAKKRAESRGYIVTILGRRCHFPRRPDGSYDWTNNGLNRLIQGSAGDQIKLALVAMGDAGLDSQVQVHDEVVGGYPSMEAARAVQSIMEGALKLRVPSRVDLAVGPSWGEAQKVK